MSDKNQQLSGNRLTYDLICRLLVRKSKHFSLSVRGFFFRFFNVLFNVLNFFVFFNVLLRCASL